jgi:hypothetical protein
MRLRSVQYVLLALGILALPEIAFGYVGPGAGLSFIGTLFAAIGALLLAVVGFIWYPVKRLLRGRRTASADTADPTQKSGD